MSFTSVIHKYWPHRRCLPAAHLGGERRLRCVYGALAAAELDHALEGGRGAAPLQLGSLPEQHHVQPTGEREGQRQPAAGHQLTQRRVAHAQTAVTDDDHLVETRPASSSASRSDATLSPAPPVARTRGQFVVIAQGNR